MTSRHAAAALTAAAVALAALPAAGATAATPARASAKLRAHEALRISDHRRRARHRPARAPRRPAQPAPAPTTPPVATPPVTAPANCDSANAAVAVLCLVNRERANAGEAALAASPQLAAAAAGHSADMVARQYFSHDSLDGRDFVARIRAAGWSTSGSWTAGENIAWGSGSYGTPAQIVTSWMNSPGHRANILNVRFREAGVGVAPGAPQRTSTSAYTYTMDFGAHG